MVGLAPAAHGANRTGRMFTGDRSGDWLFAALYRAGFASQPTSTARDDGLEFTGAYITATVHCAPPANKPTPAERAACAPYLARELALLGEAVVVVALGQFAWQAVSAHYGLRPRPAFGHLAESAAARRPDAARLVPPEPAEHVHRQADRADVRRRVHPGPAAHRRRSGHEVVEQAVEADAPRVRGHPVALVEEGLELLPKFQPTLHAPTATSHQRSAAPSSPRST
jgi:uracil-DNA glycosylase